MNLGVFKGKQVAAKKGYDLLKSKADALKVGHLFYPLAITLTNVPYCSVLYYTIILSSLSYYTILLQVRFRDICKVIYDTKVGMADQSSSAFFSLTEAEYAAG